MAIDPNIALNVRPVDLASIYNDAQRYQINNANLQMAQANAAHTQQQWQQQDQADRALSDLLATHNAQGGYDVQGPAGVAYRNANPTGYEQLLANMDANHQAQVEKRITAIGNAALGADTPEKWNAAIDYLTPLYPDLAQYKGQFSEGLRQGAIAAAGQAKAWLEQNKPMNISPGGSVYDPAQGKVVYQAAFAPHYGTVGEGQTAYVYQPGGGGAPTGGSWANVPVEQAANFLRNRESGTPAGNYDIIHYAPGQTVKLQPPQPLTQMTLGQVNDFQHQLLKAPGNDNSSAVGAYQFVGKTLASVGQEMFGNNWRNVPFSQATQDAMFQHVYGKGPEAAAQAWGPAPASLGGGGQAQIIAQGPPKQEDSTPLTPQGIEFVAQQVANGGQMPALGMGRQAAMMRAQIIGRAAQIAQANGLTGADMVGVQADVKANAAALGALTRTSSQIFAFEQTASQNGDQVLQTMGRGAAGSGIPILNKWIQSGRRSVTGDPDVSRFDVAVQTFATEYAKVISGATGGQMSTDSARKEVMGQINAAMTPEQLQAVIQQAKIDMENRRQGLQGQIETLRGAVRSAGRNPGFNGNAPESGAASGSITQSPQPVNGPGGGLGGIMAGQQQSSGGWSNFRVGQ